MRSDAVKWVAPLLVSLALVTFIMSSYPMMRPGFDIWWHLGLINHVGDIDTPLTPSPKLYWHYLWSSILHFLQIHDLFTQALVIHRAQFLLTAILITCAAYFSTLSINGALKFNRLEIWTCSVVACTIWFLMHGTHSVAHDQGVGSSLTQSWMLWYSVNYQISLPFVVFATSLTLYYFSSALGIGGRAALMVAIAISLLCVFMFHMAEIVYYVICLLVLGLLFANGRSRIYTLGAILVASAICIFGVLRFAHVLPAAFSLFDGRSISEIFQAISDQGDFLRQGEYLRLGTGWTTLHLLSLLSLLILFAICCATQDCRNSRGTRSAILFLIGTSVFSLALFTNFGAGVFAFLTYGLIAYRFAYFDLIFVGIPIVTLHLLNLVQDAFVPVLTVQTRRLGRWICFIVVICSITVVCVKSDETINLYANSLVKSLEPKEMYFGLSDKQRGTLAEEAQQFRQMQPASPICTDIFTAYYLFFIYDYKQVVLPDALSGVPGFSIAPSPCDFKSHPQNLHP